MCHLPGYRIRSLRCGQLNTAALRQILALKARARITQHLRLPVVAADATDVNLNLPGPRMGYTAIETWSQACFHVDPSPFAGVGYHDPAWQARANNVASDKRDQSKPSGDRPPGLKWLGHFWPALPLALPPALPLARPLARSPARSPARSFARSFARSLSRSLSLPLSRPLSLPPDLDTSCFQAFSQRPDVVSQINQTRSLLEGFRPWPVTKCFHCRTTHG